MNNLDRMNMDELQRFLSSDAKRANEVAAHYAFLMDQFEQRMEKLTDGLGQLNARDRNDEFRIEDLMELRDKINDGFTVWQEDEDLREGNSQEATLTTGHMLHALEQALDYLSESIREFYARTKEQVENEAERARTLIRYVDQTLGECHIRYMAAFVGVQP